jgi:hypothetical protein
MNKKILSILATLPFTSVMAQEPADALRFSWSVPGGTARQQAIGGAMGSLGGDISATYVNPAGLAFYRTGDLVLTPSITSGNHKATYLGRKEEDQTKKFVWGTTGVVLGSGGNSNRNIRNAAFSLAINRSADFNSDIQYKGQNNQSSYSQKYLEEIGNTRDANYVASGFPYGASLALNTYWIDTIAGGSSNNYQFQSRSANLRSSGLLQSQTIQNRGGVDELALGLAVNVRDKIMIGGSLGIPILHYSRKAEFLEADATANANNNFNFGLFEEELTTSGVGLNLKAGLIYKPAEFWRLGFAFHTPTVYNLTDRYNAIVTTDTEGYKGLQSQSSEYITGTESEFEYMLVTPYKVLGSISYVLREIQDVTKQRGFITADVEYVNYKASSFTTQDESLTDQGTKDYLQSLNRAIDKAYKGSFNFRVGGELKFTTLMVRLGAAYYGNPYQDINGEKGSKFNLSGGLGYRNKGFFIDLAYVHSMQRDVHYAYRLSSSPYSGAAIRSGVGNALLTIGFKI